MTTPSAPSDGTIDITNLVESLRQTWVTYMVGVTMGAEASIPGLQWAVTTPIISSLDKDALQLIFDFVSKQAEMMGFFGNTAIRKASQAKDYTDAVAFKNGLPSTATDQEYADAEAAELVAFKNFVEVTN